MSTTKHAGDKHSSRRRDRTHAKVVFNLPDHHRTRTEEDKEDETLLNLRNPESSSTKPLDVKEWERLRIHKHQREIIVQLGHTQEHVDKFRREKPKVLWADEVKKWTAKLDSFAAAHTVPKHQICIVVAAALIPFSIITITWDLLACLVFEIPHLSTINAPSFILFASFICTPVAMYGYMMEYLMRENSRMATFALICVITHPLLFAIRAVMEIMLDGFRNELKLYFEDTKGEAGQGQEFEYPIGALEGQLMPNKVPFYK